MTEISASDALKQRRRQDAIALHEVESNPFTAQDEALFEMFDREGFTPEQRIEYIQAHFSSEPSIAAE